MSNIFRVIFSDKRSCTTLPLILRICFHVLKQCRLSENNIIMLMIQICTIATTLQYVLPYWLWNTNNSTAFVLLEQRKVHGQCEDDVKPPTPATYDSKLHVSPWLYYSWKIQVLPYQSWSLHNIATILFKLLICDRPRENDV